jgi:pimeloyl-ACP methyl ester carboxylesterase
MKYNTRLIMLICFWQCIDVAIASNIKQFEPLQRRAKWNAQFNPMHQSRSGKEIKSINSDSVLHKAGLKFGDILLSVNGKKIDSNAIWSDLTDSLVANKKYELTFIRNGKKHITKAKFKPIEREKYNGIDVFYGDIINNSGVRQRTIITKPKKSNEKQAAIFMLQGLSCSSIEYTPDRNSNFIKTLQNIITGTNMVVMRVEKPGLGDSEGDCSNTDFLTELSGYENALKYLLTLDYIDPDRIIIYGNSMGSAIAPYLANKYNLNGVISDGTFYRSWFEHMLEIERRIKTMQGLKQDEISQLMNQVYIPLYYNMLINKMSYEEIITKNPLLTMHNYHQKNHMYGRPMSYYHQLQDFDFAGQWQKITAPVRVRWGTNDWIMSESDNDMIEGILKQNKHSNFEVYKFSGMDHWSTIHASAENSFKGKKGKWEDRISQQIIDWAIEINTKSNR